MLRNELQAMWDKDPKRHGHFMARAERILDNLVHYPNKKGRSHPIYDVEQLAPIVRQ